MSALKIVVGIVVCVCAIGCGGTAEVKPSAEVAPKVVPDAAKKGMEESFKHMPPEMQAKMKGQFDKTKGSN